MLDVLRLLPKLSCLQLCPLPLMSRRRGLCSSRVAPRCDRRGPQQSGCSASSSPPVYLPVSQRWQKRQCTKLRLPLVRPLCLDCPKPPPFLRNKEPCLVHEIGGDGNCLFRCLSLAVTGSESHHSLVRQRIVHHISRNCKAFSALLLDSDGVNGDDQADEDACAQYLSKSKMADMATWGSDVEILAAAHLLRTRIYVYTLHGQIWQWVEHGLELTEPKRKTCRESIYLMHTGLVHYDLVQDVCDCVGEEGEKDPNSTSAATNQYRRRKTTDTSGTPSLRCRGCSVPCTLHRKVGGNSGQGSFTRRRSCERISSASSTSLSSSGSESDCSSSYAESVGSSSPPGRHQSRQRRPGLTSASRFPTRFGSHHTYNNNNSFFSTSAANRATCRRLNRRKMPIQFNPVSKFTAKPQGKFDLESVPNFTMSLKRKKKTNLAQSVRAKKKVYIARGVVVRSRKHTYRKQPLPRKKKLRSTRK